MKRILDLLIITLLSFFILPLLILTYFLILIIDKQNPIFSQKRSGKNSKPFNLYKFKSMKLDSSNNLKVTTLGKYLRLLKIDELPQIINILKNEMSIIGPRPLYPEFDYYYNDVHKVRLNVKPGITGLAQIKLKDSTNWNTKFNYDVIYIKKSNLKLEFFIFYRTIIMVLGSMFNKDKRPKESLDYKKDFFDNYL